MCGAVRVWCGTRARGRGWRRSAESPGREGGATWTRLVTGRGGADVVRAARRTAVGGGPADGRAGPLAGAHTSISYGVESELPGLLPGVPALPAVGAAFGGVAKAPPGAAGGAD